MNKRFAIAAATVCTVLSVGAARLALAGQVYEAATCSQNASGGTCEGTFLGFRNHSDPNARAWFRTCVGPGFMCGPATHTFGASLNGVLYGCTPSTTTAALWEEAMTHRGYFRISWNSSNTCTLLELQNGSPYSNF
jgi:hypothetical protein